MNDYKEKHKIIQNNKDYLKSTTKDCEKETIKAIYNHLNVNGFIVQLQKN